MDTTRQGTRASTDAIELLTADHKAVKSLFKAYRQLVDADGEDDEKEQLALQICDKLSAHAQIEEEIFYPAVREVLLGDEDLADEAEVEHACAKDLIALIEQTVPADALYDARVKVLGEYIDHHVEEEEGEMFPKVRQTDLDLEALGAEMAHRWEELLAEAQQAP